MKIDPDWLNRIFWPKVKKGRKGCLEWQGQRLPHGYGQVHYKGKKYYPHRIIWEALRTQIPSGLCVLHKCDNPACVNVEHLFLGTHKDNTQDMMQKGRGPIGERQGGAKLTAKQVKFIRLNYFKATSKKNFAKSLGISASHCCMLAYGFFWQHLQNLKR